MSYPEVTELDRKRSHVLCRALESDMLRQGVLTTAHYELGVFLVAQALAEERERALSLVRRYLLYDSQRAVSWHEVQDCLEAIRRGEEP